MACAAALNQSINVCRRLEYISTNQNQLAFTQFNEMRQRKHRIDVTLVVGQCRRRIDAHRIILEAASMYFQTRFKSAINESHRGFRLYAFWLIYLK